MHYYYRAPLCCICKAVITVTVPLPEGIRQDARWYCSPCSGAS